MRTLTTLAAMIMVLGMGAIAAEGEGGPGKGEGKGKGRGPGGMRAKMIEKFDKDGDGKLNEEERKAAREAMKERGKGRGKGRGKEIKLTEEQRAEIKKHLLEKYDADKDGKLSEEETKAARQEILKHMMKMRAAMIVLGGPGRGKGPMNPEMRKKLLEKFDVDKDGKLSEEEREALKAAMKKRREENGGKGKGRGKGKGKGKGKGEGGEEADDGEMNF